MGKKERNEEKNAADARKQKRGDGAEKTEHKKKKRQRKESVDEVQANDAEVVVEAEPQEKNEVDAPASEHVQTTPVDFLPLESCADWRQFLEQPLAATCEQLNVSQKVLENLQAMGIEGFFPVQARIVPLLMRYAGCSVQPMDLCVSAPTGSGKTLAYAIPIVHALLPTRVHRLRALVILPTRELAMQVHGVCTRLCDGTQLKIALAVGQGEFADEAAQITGRVQFTSHVRSASSRPPVPADILITTPGRLIDHMQRTKGFSLEHVRFMVLDEADRLLTQSHAHLLKSVLTAADRQFLTTRPESGSPSDSTEEIQPRSVRCLPRTSNDLRSLPLQRLLFSATLTDNPRYLAILGLTSPITIRITDTPIVEAGVELTESQQQEGLMVPATLTEQFSVSKTEDRLLVLLSMVMGFVQRGGDQVCLIFTSSVKSTHRLARLLQVFAGTDNCLGGKVFEISRIVSQDTREAALRAALDGTAKVLVSTDKMARGIDLPNVSLVLNYDAPKHGTTYVHRVGRTARANRKGEAVTLLKQGQQQAFLRMRSEVDSRQLQRIRANKELMQQLEPRYKSSLGKLQQVLQLEDDQEMRADDTLADELLVAEPIA